MSWPTSAQEAFATDRIRREQVLAAKTGLLAAGDRAEAPMNTTSFRDERLELLFTCCHPALAIEAQVALSRCAMVASGTRGRLFVLGSAYLVP